MQAARRRHDEATNEPTEHDAENDDHDRRDHTRDVAHEFGEHVGKRFETDRIGRHEQHREHHAPEQQVGDDLGGIEMRTRSLDGLHDAAALEQLIEMHAAQ